MITATLTVDQAKQFMAITDSAHMNWEPFVVLQEQISKQLAEIAPVAAPVAVIEEAPVEVVAEVVEETVVETVIEAVVPAKTAKSIK